VVVKLRGVKIDCGSKIALLLVSSRPALARRTKKHMSPPYGSAEINEMELFL